jgi:hypothetical protein
VKSRAHSLDDLLENDDQITAKGATIQDLDVNVIGLN